MTAAANSPRPGQRWDPERYARNASFVAELGAPVVALLAPRAGERILDLGCGDGVLTEALVAAGAAVVAVDSSVEQVAAARARGLDARVADAQALTFADAFDAVFSNAALHWMTDPDAVVAGVWRALRPGGRFVGEMGGAGNVDTIRRALHAALAEAGHDPAALDPWYFPDEADYRRRLEAQGFVVAHIARIERPTPLPGEIAGWLATFAGTFLAPLDAATRRAVVKRVSAEVAPRLRDAAGRWTADYVRLRFAARRPES